MKKTDYRTNNCYADLQKNLKNNDYYHNLMNILASRRV